MAEVFLARSSGASGIAKFFAIKRILPQYAESPEFIEMFKDEAKIAINLNHSNIVSIHEFGVQNNQFFLVMDYVEGRNLRQILNKMKKTSLQFSIDQVVYMVKEVAAGLDHAHRCLDANTGKPLNITHRDMSPQNVMVSFEGEVKIVDFGIAKAESQLENTRAGTLKGKFGYMSPEQAEGQPIDLRTDIFSLGIVLWELLANDRLFSANNEINTLRKIRDCQVPSLRKINPNIHAELERITQKALARDRNLRYQTAAAFHRDLNRFLNRQYPDFSPQDFSVFTKSIFADEILSTRKRLVEYSKLGGSFQQNEPSVVYETKTDSLVTGTSSNSNEGPDVVTKSTDLKISNTNNNFVMDNSALNRAAAVLDQSVFKEGTKKNIRLETEFPEYRTSTTSIGRTNTRYTKSHVKIEDQSVFRPSTIILFLIAVLGIYSYLVKVHTIAMTPVILTTDPVLSPLHRMLGLDAANLGSVKVDPTPPPPPTPVVVTPAPPPVVAPPPEVYVLVSSKPSGANIYVDRQNTGLTTPNRIKVPGDKNFELALKRAGYTDFKRVTNYQQLGTHFQATLEETHFGYLNIDVIPIKRVKLTINGTRIYDNPPFRRRPVPANTPIHVRIDDSNGSWDETVIEVPPNALKQIRLSLRRRPAGK